MMITDQLDVDFGEMGAEVFLVGLLVDDGAMDIMQSQLG